jgi:cytochrome c-type biogenesis protein
VLIPLGLMWAGWIRLPLSSIAIRAARAGSICGAVAMGTAFAVAVCPFCTPALVVLLGIAVGIGSPLFGATLLFAFAMGRAVPVILGAGAMGMHTCLLFHNWQADCLSRRSQHGA